VSISSAHSLLIIQRVRKLELPDEDCSIGIGGIGAPLRSLRQTLNQVGMVGLAGEDNEGRSLPCGQLLK
jgi:hypothetical protein